jgi:hypothetical protein
VVAAGWFLYAASVGLPNRVRGDAVTYLRVAAGAGSITDVLGWAGERTLGFPLFLYAIRRPFELAMPLGDETLGAFVNTVAVVLLGIHVAASMFFFRRMQAVLGASLGLALHPVTLSLLVAYPGLVAYTTVPLTDTLAADLLMVGTALLAGSRAAFAGLALGALVLIRPSALVVTAALLLAATAQAAWRARGRVPALAIALLVWSALVGLQAANCTRAYDEPCLTEPAATRKALGESIGWGKTSARHYWSRWSGDAEGRVTVPDALLTRLLGATCPAHTLLGGDGLLACLVAQPLAYPAMVIAKSIGLCDTYQLQPYAVDVTPRWARLASRPFGALAFAGLAAAAVWFVVLLRTAPAGLLALVLVVPVAHVAWHALFHVEARYGLPAVPFALVMLVATLQWAWTKPRATVAAVTGALALAGVFFLMQTGRWDRADPVLARIEAGPS